jgi:hypothetical protein
MDAGVVLPVLTVLQPCAAAIVAGVKVNEYRRWLPPSSIIGGHLLIHAAANRRFVDDPRAMAAFRSLWPDMPTILDFGSIIGAVHLDEAGHGDVSPRWEHPSCGNVKWSFSSPRQFKVPFPCRGRRGISYFCLPRPSRPVSQYEAREAIERQSW